MVSGKECARGRYGSRVSTVEVALIFGGRSSEHSISCISAASVWEALEDDGYRVLPIAVTPDSGMVRYPGSPSSLRADQLPVVREGDATVVIPADPGIHGILVDGLEHRVDVAFPILHGPWGEDGTIQGLLELAGIPYVGSGVLASALCMDKIMLKTMLRGAGLPVAPWVAIDASAWPKRAAELLSAIEELGDVVFVKPARAGSSVGITKVGPGADHAALVRAIDEARRHDPRVIVEQAVLGAREIECGVRGTAGGDVTASTCAEIVVRDGFDFYDFEAKYIADGADLVVPAELDDTASDHVRRLAIRCFTEAGCEGLARVDFFVSDEDIVINEVNTMPGFTPISMFPRMWQATGVEYPQLIGDLIGEALSRPHGLR